MARRSRTRTIQPKFIRFCISVFLLLISIVLLIIAVVFGSKSCNPTASCSGSPDSLSIGNPVIDVDASDAPDGMTETTNTENAVVASPPELPDGVRYTVQASEAAKPANFGFTYEIRRNNQDETYSENPQKNEFSFGKSDSYSGVRGITTFGGNHYRNSFSYGTASVTMRSLSQVWSYSVGALSGFGGVCWTGQPLIVVWEGDVLKTLGVREEYRVRSSLTEVIYCAADGNIYFFEAETGNRTRENIAVGVPMFGTPALDPTGAPMLYIGQGTCEEGNKSKVFAVNLVNNTYQTIISGRDYTAHRNDWSAFDSSPLIISDTLIWPSENGVLYLVKLNTSYHAETGELSIQPGDRIKYRYNGTGYADTSVNGKRWYGYESSVSAFQNYLFLCDNGGRLQCIDLNTLKLQYVVDIGDDADASIVIEEDGNDGTFYLYAVGQTASQDPNLPAGYGYSYVKKINGLTGQTVWQKEQIGITVNYAKAGAKATPHIGKGTIGDLLICSYYGLAVDTLDEIGNTTYAYGGKIVAYDRENGSVRWEIKQLGNADYVSSPLVVYSERGDAYLIACDRSGAVKLYDAADPGENPLSALQLGDRIDATPVAFGNYIYVATTGTATQTRIYCLKLE